MRIDLGSLVVHVVSDGGFRLDGGAMFGVVPKNLWSRQKTADDENRVTFGTNCLLVEAGNELVLVDTGLGDKHDAKFEAIYGYEPGARRLPDSIAAAGFEPGDVTHVVLSHLHFDHSGWNTRREESGRVVPTFPKARYWLERGEVEHARNPTERDRASYFPDNWEPLFEAGVVELVDVEGGPTDSIRMVKAPGHNADMCVVTLDGGGRERGIFLADLCPSTAHVPLPWIMAYDLYPLVTLATRKLWYPRLAAESWVCFFEHDYESPVGRIVESKPGRFAAAPLR
jgi:glyoxylase-like metal-dependent hydrolase (beta-lactamase superfamily II)